MASYIGKVQIGSANPVLVGSTLYGICGTAANAAAKNITATTNGANNEITGDYVNTSYDNLIRGTTIHIKFTQGNEVTSNATLQVGTLTTTQPVDGNFTCPPNTIISFTLDENQHWVVNDNVDTNTEYVFKTPYNATTNQVIGTADVGTAAEKDVTTALVDGDNSTTNNNLPTATAVVRYVLNKTAGLSGLSGAMHFKGQVSSIPPASGTYESGDVVLAPNDKEYVYDGTNWIELGDESSYALKSSTDTITEVASSQTVSVGSASGWDAGGQASLTITANTNTAASLTENPVQIPYVNNVGSATTASVAAGILNITVGAAPTIADTPITVKEIGTFTPNVPIGITFTTNTLPQLTVTPTDTSKITTSDTVVVVPDNNTP